MAERYDALVPERFSGKLRPAWRGGYYAGSSDKERETRMEYDNRQRCEVWTAGNPYLAEDERFAWFAGYDAARTPSRPNPGAAK